ncbi:hypothetical protein H6G91_10135 [Nostoc muscorum FACHB-395]|nr:hypothetical protein [Desmonostoc muscorum FACHB-395]
MSKFLLLDEKFLLFSEKNETAVERDRYFSLWSEMKNYNDCGEFSEDDERSHQKQS